jgi:hypothetical protein
MTVSDRDRKIIMVIVPLVVVLGYWFMLLAPKREAAAAAEATLTSEQARLSEAEARATTVQAAKANFASDYAAVVALGKAIPTSVDMPSLLVQLEAAAKGTGIELDGITIGDRTPAASASPAAAGSAAPDPGAAPAPTGQPPASAPGQAVASAQGAADAAAPPAGTATPATGTQPGAEAPATGGLESVELEFNFKGSFFELADYFHRLKRFVYVDGDRVRVRGRLLTIDTVEYAADPEAFPALTATVHASVFLTPRTEGPTAGASPAGPDVAPAAATAAPVSAASSGSGTATPPTAVSTP